AGLAHAKLGNTKEAFELSEEAMRYDADAGKTWNVYAATMSALKLPRKAIAAERTAVLLAESPLDLALYQFGLTLSLLAAQEDDEAMRLLDTVVTSLKSKEFEQLRRATAKAEAFETYSTTVTREEAYRTLLLRTQLQLA